LGVFAQVPLIVDTSALTIWRRVPTAVRESFAQAAQAHELRTHPVVLLEFLHDAFDRASFDVRDQRFSALDQVTLTEADGATALQAMRDLAHREPIMQGYHKVKAGDALIAASAVRLGMGVLHYDHDFERLAEVMPTLVEIAFAPFGSI
jgi:predicted nucleic acid-binding protein